MADLIFLRKLQDSALRQVDQDAFATHNFAPIKHLLGLEKNFLPTDTIFVQLQKRSCHENKHAKTTRKKPRYWL